jgi:hypothetical protein
MGIAMNESGVGLRRNLHLSRDVNEDYRLNVPGSSDELMQGKGAISLNNNRPHNLIMSPFN